MPKSHTDAISPESFDNFGALLRHLRLRVRLTQRDLGTATGYNFAHICRIERGERSPDTDMIRARFVPALMLEHEPQWVIRLVTLATATKPPLEIPPTFDAELFGVLESIPPAPTNEVARPQLVAQLHARLLNEQCLVLCGLPGMGKTTLIAAIAREYARSQPVFWMTLTEGLNTSIENIVQQLGLYLFQQKRPEVRLTFAKQSATPPLQRQIQMIQAGLRGLCTQANGSKQTTVKQTGKITPLLCFDNAHCIQDDPAIRQLLDHLLNATPTRIILSSREEVTPFVRGTRVPMARLTQAEGMQLARAVALESVGSTQTLSDATIEKLLQRIGGSPMLLRLALAEQSEGNHFNFDSLESNGQIASYLLEHVQRRISRQAWGLLALACVARQPINLLDTTLIELCEAYGMAEAIGAHFELVRHQLIDDATHANPHPLIRDFVLATLAINPILRKRLHRIIAEYADGALDDGIEAAYHYVQAGEPKLATDALTQRQIALHQRGQSSIAVSIIEGALNTLTRNTRQVEIDRDLWARLHVLRGFLLTGTSRTADVATSFQEALKWTQDSQQRAYIINNMASYLLLSERESDLLDLIQRCLQDIPQDELLLRAQLAMQAGRVHRVLSNFDAAEQTCREAFLLIEKIKRNTERRSPIATDTQSLAHVEARVHSILAFVFYIRYELDRADREWQIALQIARTHGLDLFARGMENNLALILIERGEINVALNRWQDAVASSAGAVRYDIAETQSWCVALLIYQCRFAQALEVLQQCRIMFEQVGVPSSANETEHERARIALLLGNLHSAERLLALLPSVTYNRAHEDYFPQILVTRAQLYVLNGSIEAAQSIIEWVAMHPYHRQNRILGNQLIFVQAICELVQQSATAARQTLNQLHNKSASVLVQLQETLVLALVGLAEQQLLQGIALAQAAEIQASNYGHVLWARIARQIGTACSNSTAHPNYAQLLWMLNDTHDVGKRETTSAK